MQSQVSFNRVPEKVWEALVQSHVRFNRICGHLIHGNPAEVFPALGFAARFRKICKNKTLRLLGIPSKLIFLLVEKTLRTSAFPSVHIVGSLTSKLPSSRLLIHHHIPGGANRAKEFQWEYHQESRYIITVLMGIPWEYHQDGEMSDPMGSSQPLSNTSMD